MDRVINKKMIEKLKHNVYQHRLQIILLILAFVVILNLASVSAIMYINKKKVNKTVVYENSTKFLTVYNSSSITQTQEEKKEEEKPTITFKDQTDTVLTITNTPFYEDYNKDTNGNIEKDTKIERIGISNDNVWSKLKYNNKIIYVKTENLKLFVEEIIDPNENNDSE